MEKEDRLFQVSTLQHRAAARYHGELTRFSTWLFSSLVVAMTFLLLAGLRNPHPLLLVFLYVALGSFALVILAHPFISLWSGQLLAKQLIGQDKKLDKKIAAANDKAVSELRSWLNAVRIAQQLLFVVGLVATVGFAVEVSLYFFMTTPAATPSSAG